MLVSAKGKCHFTRWYERFSKCQNEYGTVFALCAQQTVDHKKKSEMQAV